VATCRLADNRVSGRHATVSRSRGGFSITDLGSRNGTLVDGRPISGATPAGDGTLLLLGGTVLMLRVLSDQALAAIRAELVTPLGPVATLSAKLAEPILRLRRLAVTDEAILLSGETGVGKEVYARAVHRASGRPGQFVPINCAALPADLVESELFGFARGAHVRAAASKPGLVEQAQHGTLFFDELGAMASEAQVKLLRFLDDHSYVPLGASKARSLDVRVLGASSSITSDGEKARPSHGLRRDLLARFGAQPVLLPPLRERREDVGTLARHFLGPARPLETAALLALCLYDWPQNVRQLEKVIAEAVLSGAPRAELRLAELPAPVQARVTAESSPSAAHPPRRERPHKAELEALLAQHQGNVAGVARALDRQWGVVWRWLQQSGIDADRHRK
jgi:transcriptional regulator with PAS, ATPase and Fis domain